RGNKSTAAPVLSTLAPIPKELQSSHHHSHFTQTKVIRMNHSATKLPLFVLALTLIAFSLTPVAAEDTPKVLFEENFAGKLGEGWQWLRERPEHWRIADGTLIIDTLPGSY